MLKLHEQVAKKMRATGAVLMMNQPVLLSPAILYLNELDNHKHLNIKLSHSCINTDSHLLVVLQTLSERIIVGTGLSRGIHGFTVRETVSWTIHNMGLPSGNHYIWAPSSSIWTDQKGMHH